MEETNIKKEIPQENVMNEKGQGNIFGRGQGPLGLPVNPDWKWFAIGAGISYLIYSYYANNLYLGLLILLVVVLWIRR